MSSRGHKSVCVSLWAGIVFLCASACAWAQPAGTLTLATGKVGLIRGTAVYAVAEGVKLQAGDILQTDAKGQAQVEFPGAAKFNLGAATQALLLNVPRGRSETEIVVLAGWLKVALKKSDAGGLRVYAPGAQIAAEDGAAVVHAGANVVEIFVESGAVKFSETSRQGITGSTRTVKGGEFIARTGEQPPGTAGRPPAPFITAMPRHFQDNLPVLIDRYKEKKADPKREREATYAEVEAWLKAPALRKSFVRRFHARARDAEFRKGLVDNLREHPEWDPVLYPEKYRPKRDQSQSGSPE